MNINNDFSKHCGTEQWHVNPLYPKYTYTDGIKDVAETLHAYWLIDYIFSYQAELRKCNFQVWKFSIQEDKSCVVVLSDGNEKVVFTKGIEYTDLPVGELTLWLTDFVLLLPSEY